MGKELRSTFLEAGFSDIQTSASFDFFGTAEDVAFLHAFIVDWFFSPDVTSAVSMIRNIEPEKGEIARNIRPLRQGH